MRFCFWEFTAWHGGPKDKLLLLLTSIKEMMLDLGFMATMSISPALQEKLRSRIV